MPIPRATPPTGLFSHREHRAHRLGVAPHLPMSRVEMDALGWDTCDVILVSGDAYVDHPSFGMALIGRVLEAQGFRVGIIAQPDWRSAGDFARLGRPELFFGVTSGNMDSMVNRYTADRRPRSDDAYSPDGAAALRPDRAVLVYAHRCREAFADVPVVLGGIEASLRRLAHYDYWSDTVRRSALVDAKADLLIYGSGERPVVEIAHRLAAGDPLAEIADVRGTAVMRQRVPESWIEIDAQRLGDPRRPPARSGAAGPVAVIRLPSFEAVRRDRLLYAHAARVVHAESNPKNARAIVQRSERRDVWINPPAAPLTTAELDAVYELPYARQPHPAYRGTRIPAYEMIRCSVTIMRGCFGGCTFCTLAAHEGRIVQSRSAESVVREIETIRDTVPGFTGVISDVGGPTANIYSMGCRSEETAALCRRSSCLYPKQCKSLVVDHRPLIEIYRRARAVPGVKKVLVASGVRFDLAVSSPEYVRELAQHHVGGYLKIAPEHSEAGPLRCMGKPRIEVYERFARQFARASHEAGKEQYLIPYFIAAHPGTTDEDMLCLALWLKHHRLRLDQVQTFLPTPMALATTMYWTGRDPRQPLRRDDPEISVPRGTRQRRLHKAFLRYHDTASWPLLRGALRAMGREELVGQGKRCLVPGWTRRQR